MTSVTRPMNRKQRRKLGLDKVKWFVSDDVPENQITALSADAVKDIVAKLKTGRWVLK